MTYNAIQYSSGKLWALPDWPETVELSESCKNHNQCAVVDPSCECDMKFLAARDASIKGRVEFKNQGQVLAEISFNPIEQAIQFKPEGFEIKVDEWNVYDTESQTPRLVDVRKYAILVPIAEEQQIGNRTDVAAENVTTAKGSGVK